MASTTTTVLVIGCGPVGLFAAYLLGQRGIPTLIIDKHHTRRGQPKAHALNPRTLEIFRQSGLDVPHLRHIGLDPNLVDVVRFVDNFYGWEYGSLSYERQFEDAMSLTPEPLLNIAQPIVEEYLLNEISKITCVTIQRGVEWVNTQQRSLGHNLTSTLIERTTKEEYAVESKFLIACDGARSKVRKTFDIPFNSIDGGPRTDRHHVTVHFRADLPGKRSGILFFNMQARGVRAFIRYGQDEWVFVQRFDPTNESPSSFDEDTCLRIVHDALGKKEHVQILSTTIWQSSTRIAESYRPSAVPNAFLAGDAAHTFPPTGGLGVNTGFADIHNLIWKLDTALQGIASDSLLETYEKERKPVAENNAGQSSLNEERMDQLGARINPGGSAPRPDQLSDPQFQKQVQDGIELNAPHFDSLDLQLGYIYGQARDSTQSISCFRSTFAKGARLPHIYIDATRSKSILDLVHYSKFTIFTSKSDIWLELEKSMGTPSKDWLEVVILDTTEINQEWLHQMFTSDLNRAVLVRPDQHIAGFVSSGHELCVLLKEFLQM